MARSIFRYFVPSSSLLGLPEDEMLFDQLHEPGSLQRDGSVPRIERLKPLRRFVVSLEIHRDPHYLLLSCRSRFVDGRAGY